MLRPHPRPIKSEFLAMGPRHQYIYIFNSLGNFYEQPDLRTTVLREAYSKQSHIGGRLLRGSQLGLFLYLLKFGTKGKWSLVSSSMDAPGPSQGGPSHWSQLQYHGFPPPLLSGNLVRALPNLE